MFLHYNNGEEKLITDILCIDIIDGNHPAIVTLRNGKELRIRLDRIETILNDNIMDGLETDEGYIRAVLHDR